MDRMTRQEIEEWRHRLSALWMTGKTIKESQDSANALCDLALQSLSVRSEALEEKFWVVEAVNEDDTVLSPPAYWYGGFVGSSVAGHVGSDIHALCTRFQNAQTAEYVKCLLRNAKIQPDRGHHWKIFKHIALSPARVAEEKDVHVSGLRG